MRCPRPLILLPLLAGCSAVPEPGQSVPPPQRPAAGQAVPPPRPVAPPAAGFRAPQILRAPGLEGVIEQDVASLTRQFGAPRLDVREGDARKLQFSVPSCVLDVFLYPLRQGTEPVATHVEARRSSDGQEVDRAACIQALKRRG